MAASSAHCVRDVREDSSLAFLHGRDGDISIAELCNHKVKLETHKGELTLAVQRQRVEELGQLRIDFHCL